MFPGGGGFGFALVQFFQFNLRNKFPGCGGGYGFALALVCLLGVVSASDVESRIKAGDPRGKLIFSTLLYRHGDRTPAYFFPTDPNSAPNDWSVGMGQLTNEGRQQHYALGQWLRQRYGGELLPELYSENDIYVQASDVDRTLDSAYCNLAGLYPPIGDEIWNKHLLWQPIPVHTVPAEYDVILGATQPNCPQYNLIFANLSSAPDVTKLVSDHIDQVSTILTDAGEPLSSSLYMELLETWILRDTLYVETLYKKALPAWTNLVFPNEWVDELCLKFYTLPASTSAIAKFRVGYFWKDLLDRCSSKAAGTLSPDLSLYAYSAHDLNIASVLEALGMFDNKLVDYAATLLFELRVRNGVTYMEIYYKRSYATDSADLLYIPFCGYSCPLDTLYELYSDILPTQDWNTACGLTTGA